MRLQRLGGFIRGQRRAAQLSLRKLAKLAGVSIPYLSQIERGLRRPSAEILQAIARGLRISAHTLYVQAGILEDRPRPDVHTAIMDDPALTERQKQVVLQVYESFRDETERRRAERRRTRERRSHVRTAGRAATRRRSAGPERGRREGGDTG